MMSDIIGGVTKTRREDADMRRENGKGRGNWVKLVPIPGKKSVNC